MIAFERNHLWLSKTTATTPRKIRKMTDFIAKNLSSILVNKLSEANALVGKGFKPVRNSQAKKGILFWGMNPAGNSGVAKAAQNSNYFYLNYITDSPKGKIKQTTNNTYFKPIYSFTFNITKDKGGCKWDWCNLDWTYIEAKLNKNGFNPTDIQEVRNFYDKHKDNAYTIYIGDAWYIHMTKQSDFVKLIDDNKRGEHIKEMLDLHIDEISKCSELKAIYVNNATLSHWVSEAFNISSLLSVYNYKNVPICFGSMLSGQRAMDLFSKIRLENEIKNLI